MQFYPLCSVFGTDFPRFITIVLHDCFFSLLIRRFAKAWNTKPQNAAVNSLGEDNSASSSIQSIARSSLKNFSNRSSLHLSSKARTGDERRRKGSCNDAARSSHYVRGKGKDLGSFLQLQEAKKVADITAKDIPELRKHPMNRNSLNLQVPGDPEFVLRMP